MAQCGTRICFTIPLVLHCKSNGPIFQLPNTGQLPGVGLPASKLNLPKYNDAVISDKSEFSLVLSWKHHKYHLCTKCYTIRYSCQCSTTLASASATRPTTSPPQLDTIIWKWQQPSLRRGSSFRLPSQILCESSHNRTLCGKAPWKHLPISCSSPGEYNQ